MQFNIFVWKNMLKEDKKGRTEERTKVVVRVNLPFNLFQTDCKEGVRSYSSMPEDSESEAMRSKPPHIDQSSRS